MKHLKLCLGQLVLLCVALCAAGNIAFAQSMPSGYIPVANEYQSIDVPAGAKLTAEYGCSGAWSKPFTLSGPLTGVGVQPSSFPGAVDASLCNKNILIILEATVPVTVTVHALAYNSAGVLINTPSSFTIPVLATTATAPPTAASTVCSVSPTLTQAVDGTVTIVIPPPCIIKQTGGAWANTLTGDGYSIYILGNPSQGLFAGQ